MKILHREISNTLERTDLWTVQPDSYDQKYRISITRPITSGGQFHGIILTDGNQVVGTAAQLTGYLEMGQLIPPNVLITVGYPLDNPLPSMVARNRDLTPTPWPEWDAAYGAILKLPCPASGQCDAFRSFLIDELKPLIGEEYSIDPDEWMLGGHSLGGLFSTHTLLKSPPAFKRYFAVGSSYWWQHQEIFKLAQEYSPLPVERDLSVYIAAGELESAAHMGREWIEHLKTPEWQEYIQIMGGIPEIVGDSAHMSEILGRCPDYRVKSQTLANETHGTAVFAAMSQGFRWLYGTD